MWFKCSLRPYMMTHKHTHSHSHSHTHTHTNTHTTHTHSFAFCKENSNKNIYQFFTLHKRDCYEKKNIYYFLPNVFAGAYNCTNSLECMLGHRSSNTWLHHRSWLRWMVPTYGYIIDHTSELRCMVAEVCSGEWQRSCFSGYRCANKLVLLFDPCVCSFSF